MAKKIVKKKLKDLKVKTNEPTHEEEVITTPVEKASLEGTKLHYIHGGVGGYKNGGEFYVSTNTYNIVKETGKTIMINTEEFPTPTKKMKSSIGISRTNIYALQGSLNFEGWCYDKDLEDFKMEMYNTLKEDLTKISLHAQNLSNKLQEF